MAAKIRFICGKLKSSGEPEDPDDAERALSGRHTGEEGI
jgi:hypothetical protein